MSYREKINGIEYSLILQQPYNFPTDLLVNWVAIKDDKIAFLDETIFYHSGLQIKKEIKELSIGLIENDVFTSIAGELQCYDLLNAVIPNNKKFKAVFYNITKVINRYIELGNKCTSICITIPHDTHEVFNDMFRIFGSELKDINIIISTKDDIESFEYIKNYMFFKRDKKTFSNYLDSFLKRIGSIKIKK